MRLFTSDAILLEADTSLLNASSWFNAVPYRDASTDSVAASTLTSSELAIPFSGTSLSTVLRRSASEASAWHTLSPSQHSTQLAAAGPESSFGPARVTAGASRSTKAVATTAAGPVLNITTSEAGELLLYDARDQQADFGPEQPLPPHVCLCVE